MIGDTSHSLVIRASCVDSSDLHGVPTVHDALEEECLKKKQGWTCCSATRAGHGRVYRQSQCRMLGCGARLWSNALSCAKQPVDSTSGMPGCPRNVRSLRKKEAVLSRGVLGFLRCRVGKLLTQATSCWTCSDWASPHVTAHTSQHICTPSLLHAPSAAR